MVVFKVLMCLYVGSLVTLLPLVGSLYVFGQEPSVVPGMLLAGGLVGASVGAAKWLGADGERPSVSVRPGCMMFLMGITASWIVGALSGAAGYGPFVPIVGLLVTGTASRTGLTPMFLGGLGVWLSILYWSAHARTFPVSGWLTQCGLLLVLFVVASIVRRLVKWDFQDAPTPEQGPQRQLDRDGRSLVDLLQMPDGDDIDFEPPRLEMLTRPAEQG